MGVMNEDRLTLYDGLIKTHITNTTVAKETGKGLSTNDYTTTEKNKLAGIADGANKTIVDSALNTSSENPVQNKVIAGEINTLKKSVSDGKTLVATAITDKGVDTAADATFAVMAENIGQIETGGGELHGATISVTTPEETLIGKTITLSLNDTVVATRTFDDNGACSFTDVQEAGTYSLYSTDGTDSATIPVDITTENVVNKTVISCEFYLTPDGETITPVDDVAILLKCAEIKDKSYTTMDELLADEQAMGDITMSENAMKYLARSTGFADAVCANETFMTLLGASSYVDATVLNSDVWLAKINDSSNWNMIFNELIPTMTSNTVPYGVASSNNSRSGNEPFKAFDKIENNYWCPPLEIVSSITNYLMYQFRKNVKISRLKIYLSSLTGGDSLTKTKIQAYDVSKSEWVDMYTSGSFDSRTWFEPKLSKSFETNKIRCIGTVNSNMCIHIVQAYGREQ